MIRVTSGAYADRLVSNLGSITARQARYQAQISTGQRIALPEDDPSAVRRTLDLEGERGRVGQYGRNITRLKETATTTQTAMRALSKIATRASELAVKANSVRSPDDLKAYAAEVTQMIQQAVSAANANLRGESVLGGTRNDTPAYAITLAADGRVQSVTYQGNQGVPSLEIAEGQEVSASVVGSNPTGSGPAGLIQDPRSGADLFGHLIQLQDQLLAGNGAAVTSTTAVGLQADTENLLRHVAANGVIQGRLEAAGASVSDRLQALEGQISAETDADLAKVLVQLNQTQVSYQAALQTGGRILQMSLMDYLR
jgi:flagellar hook-associated protein 3 FlgL